MDRKLEFRDGEAYDTMRGVGQYVLFGILVFLMSSVLNAQILPKPDMEFGGKMENMPESSVSVWPDVVLFCQASS